MVGEGGTRMGIPAKRTTWFAAGALFLIVAGTASYFVGRHLIRTSPSMARKVHAPLPVQVAAAEKVNLTEVTGAVGVVEPTALVKLSVESGARVEEVAVDVGEMVHPGHVLVRFDRALLAAAQKTAQAAYARAGGERERAGLEFKRVEAMYRKGYPDALLKTAHAAYHQAKGERERASLNLKRVVAIYDRGLLPKIEVEKAQGEEQKAIVHFNEAQEGLLRAQKSLQTEIEKARSDMEEADARFSEAEERLLRTDRALRDAVLVSPVVGIVMDRQINSGEIVHGLEQKILEIGRIDEVIVAAKVAEERVGSVRLNQPASVSFNAYPNDVFEGEVVKIKPVTDPETKTFIVYVRVSNPELKLKPGLTGFVRVRIKREALAVPSLALINPTGAAESTVFVVEDGTRVRLTKVRIGAISEGMTEIIDGLSSGDEVVTVGQFYLRDKDRVRIGDEFKNLAAKIAQKEL